MNSQISPRCLKLAALGQKRCVPYPEYVFIIQTVYKHHSNNTGTVPNPHRSPNPYRNCYRFLSGVDYQFLERSKTPTYHFQKSLPHLPIPKLEESCRKYLDGISPLISAEQKDRTKKVVDRFMNGEGRELHEALVQQDKVNKNTSYITEPWFEMYLRSRIPLPINYNPFMAWALDPKMEYNEQLCRATNMVVSIGRFKRSLDAKILSPEVFYLNPKVRDSKFYHAFVRNLPEAVSFYGSALFKAIPLDMSQHPQLFNTTRIPQIGKDKIKTVPQKRHLLVMKKGHFYVFDMFDERGDLHQPNTIHRALHSILQKGGARKSSQHPLGIFTTMERDKWAKVRQKLQNVSEKNAKNLDVIDSALFCLNLDENNSQEPEVVIKNLLMGDAQAENRWFDKSLQIIVQANGLASVNFEHSWGDGVAVLRLMQDVQKDSILHRFVAPGAEKSTTGPEVNVTSLDFDFTDELKRLHADARNEYKNWCESLDFGTCEYFDMNRRSVKKHGLSPDALMQMAIQLAYHRIYHTGQLNVLWSSASLELGCEPVDMCPCQLVSVGLPLVMLSKKLRDNVGVKGIRELMHKCSNLHYELAKDASMGKGFDRHLFGLKDLASRQNRPVPELFTDESYATSNHYILSSSTLSTETIMLGGFGPVVKDGFGIGYNIVNDKLGCIVSSYKSERNAKQFADEMRHGLDDLKRILENSKPITDKKLGL